MPSTNPSQARSTKAASRSASTGSSGSFELTRSYYYHPGKKLGHFPADAALGLENGNTPALTRLVCLEGADESSYQKAEDHLRQTGGIEFSARQIQRLVQSIGKDAQAWQQREALKPLPEAQAVPKLYVSADATGVPMRREELAGRKGKQPDGTAKDPYGLPGMCFHPAQAGRKKARSSATTIPLPMFRALRPSTNLARCCARRPSDGDCLWPPVSCS